MRRYVLLLTLVITATTAGGCGGDRPPFCGDFAAVSGELAQSGLSSPDSMGQLADRMEAIDPPKEIEESYETLATGFAQLAESGSPSDPDMASTLASIQRSLGDVQSYVADHCS